MERVRAGASARGWWLVKDGTGLRRMRARASLLAALAAILAVLPVAGARADVPATALPAWVTDGPVEAVAPSTRGTVYIYERWS